MKGVEKERKKHVLSVDEYIYIYIYMTSGG